jgi:hypothetical protein
VSLSGPRLREDFSVGEVIRGTRQLGSSDRRKSSSGGKDAKDRKRKKSVLRWLVHREERIEMEAEIRRLDDPPGHTFLDYQGGFLNTL